MNLWSLTFTIFLSLHDVLFSCREIFTISYEILNFSQSELRFRFCTNFVQTPLNKKKVNFKLNIFYATEFFLKIRHIKETKI
jgi:hypothetical protein